MNSMIEIDPMLFIKCRLCLKHNGRYQIDPNIRDRIKFCYEIEVESFDGLSQLICRKCEKTLRENCDTKTNFINNQKYLKIHMSLKKDILKPQQENVSSLENDSEKESKLLKKFAWRKKLSRTSVSSSDQCSVSNENSNNLIVKSWENSYNKLYECRFCKYTINNQDDVLDHVRTCYNQVQKKYRHVFEKQCVLQVKKLDNKPNLTGLNETVVLSNKKIKKTIAMDHLIVYSIKENNYKYSENVDEHNTEEDTIVKKKLKKRRISSSSTDTAILTPYESEGQSVVNPTEQKEGNVECIKIEDSSNSDTDTGNVSDKKNSEMKSLQIHRETIQGIISAVQTNFCENTDESIGKAQHNKGNQSVDIESQLKCKILSIGTKIINKQGFNCTGLLRYMEHNNLKMNWTPKIANSPTYKDYIRIMIKLRGNVEQNDTSWRTLTDQELAERNYAKIPITESEILTPRASFVEGEPKQSVVICNNDSHNNNSGQINSQSKNKLLNENPVANPKQLPKKTPIFTETKPNNSKITTSENSNNDLVVDVVTAQTNADDNSCLPIIASTASLATHNDNSSNNNSEHGTEVNEAVNGASISRIKVKPVSELMSERVLNNIAMQNHNIGMLQYQARGESMPQRDVNHVVCTHTSPSTMQDHNVRVLQYQAGTNYIPGLLVQNGMSSMPLLEGSNIVHNTMRTSQTEKNANYVILHTNKLPNTKTNAPIKYIKKLLLMHSIVLLDTKEVLGPNFTCLLRYKVQYKLSNKEEPVNLRLSLFCYNNYFCIKVVDLKNEIIDLNELTSIWQWEIMKIFTGDTVSKLFENALKVSRACYEYTKCFCDLIKSISIVS